LVWRHQRGWGDLQHRQHGWWSNQQHFDEVNKYRAPTGMEDNMEENEAEWSTMITTGMELRQHPGAEAPKQQSSARHGAQHMRAWSAHN
jgi:hypothetical protein